MAAQQKWYGSQRWRNRAKAQLRAAPLCAYCQQRGLVVPAAHADHIVPHKGDAMLFEAGALQSLCVECHNRFKQGDERRGYSRQIGLDGEPVDKAHPIYRAAEHWEAWKRSGKN
jgi:5-methylcytosine-specific restriction enzyme A